MRKVVRQALSEYQRDAIRDARNELGGICHCGELCIRFSDGSLMPFDTYYTEDVLRSGVWIVGAGGRELYRLTRALENGDVIDILEKTQQNKNKEK